MLWEGFQKIKEEALNTGKPILVECVCERFRGHSISDPGLYRSKDDLKKIMERDPIFSLKSELEKLISSLMKILKLWTKRYAKRLSKR